jgi:predicted kinase
MPSIYCMRGLPGSGKTTVAKDLADICNAVRVSRDDIRQTLFNRSGVLNPQAEKEISSMEHHLAEDALDNGYSVIVDNLNLRTKYLQAWYDLAQKKGVGFHVEDVHTGVDICVYRNKIRAERDEPFVPEDVVREMAKKFYRGGKYPEFTPREPKVDLYHNSPDLPWVTLVDIDGTMADMGDRNPYDESTVSQDTPHKHIVRLVSAKILKGDFIVFISGRTDGCYDDTYAWLRKHLPGGYDMRWSLFMRKRGDSRNDAIVKKEIFDQHIRDRFHVEFILDDRDQVVKMWRHELGLPVLQVAEGNF